MARHCTCLFSTAFALGGNWVKARFEELSVAHAATFDSVHTVDAAGRARLIARLVASQTAAVFRLHVRSVHHLNGAVRDARRENSRSSLLRLLQGVELALWCTAQ